MLTRYPCALPPVCVRTHKNDHVQMLNKDPGVHVRVVDYRNMKTQHALVGLGNAALSAAVALPR